MKKMLMLLATLYSAHFAFAGDDPTEFLYQAKGGTSFVQGNLNYLMHDEDLDPTGSIEITDMDITAKYEMGFSDMLAVYGSLGFGQATFKLTGLPEDDMNGLDPINLGVKYRMAMGPGQIYVQGNLGLGLLEKDKGDNRMDGSMNLAARLGYIMSYDTASSGLVVDFGLFSTDGKDDATDNEFEKEGSFAISAFYEMMMTDMVFGLAGTYSIDGGFGGIGGTSLYGLFTGKNADDNYSIFTLKAYTRIPMAEGLQLLGSLGYGFLTDIEHPGDDSGSNIDVNVGIRYLM